MSIHDLLPEINGFKHINLSPSLTLCLFPEIGDYVTTKAHVYKVQSGAEEVREGGARVAISSLMAVKTKGFLSPAASASSSRKRRNRRARLKLCRVYAAKRMIPALVGKQVVVGVLSDLPKADVVGVGFVVNDSVAAPDCSGSGDVGAWLSAPASPSLDKDSVVSKDALGVLLDAVATNKDSSILKSGRKMVIPMRQGLRSNLPTGVQRRGIPSAFVNRCNLGKLDCFCWKG